MRRARALGVLTGFTAAVAAAGLMTGGPGAAARTIVAASTAAAGSTAAGPASVSPAEPGSSASPAISATTKLGLRRYVAAGTRAYVVGAENGTFPPIGWHITGQMGGVWAPPVKLLDGAWFQVQGTWLDSATTYTTGPGFVRMTFPVTGGLRPTLTEFAPDGLPTALIGLTLVPVHHHAVTTSVVADAHSQVAAAYPWSFSKPTFDTFNHQNSVAASQGFSRCRCRSRPRPQPRR